tara:strand:- start:177 stop:338 length:162 start_codon:yes stop_codon:yes gene_type:complete
MAKLSGSQFRKKDFGYSLSKHAGWKASKSLRYTLRPAKAPKIKSVYGKYRSKK